MNQPPDALAGYLVLAARVTLGLVLLTSITTKIRDRGAFREFLGWLRRLTVVPARLVVAVGVAMVLAEAAALVLLAVPAAYPGGLALAAGMTAFFAAAIGWTRRRGVVVPCRCFGRATTPMGPVEIVRNLVLTAMGAAAAITAQLSPPPGPSPVIVVQAALLGGGLAMVVVRLDDVVRLFGRAGTVSASGTERG
jgi:hypothetical protein